VVKGSNPYTPVKLPLTLILEIDKFVGSKYGYRSRAEFVKEGCRVLLRQYNPSDNPKKED